MDITRPMDGPADRACTSEPSVVPATFAQQRLWFLDQLQPGNIAYLIAWSIPLSGPLDVGALERSLEELINRHEVLKGTFVQSDGEVRVVVPENVRFPLRVVEVSGPEDVRRIAEEESRTPINLETGPMVRATLVRTSTQKHTLLLTLHHISFDGSSRAIFVRELQTLYNAFQGRAFRNDNDSPLPPPQLQYSDYADWQQRRLQGKRYQRLLGYWKKQLADLPEALNLPTDKPRPATETLRGGRKAFELPRTLSAGLADLARQRRCSLFMVSLTAFQILLAKYSGQDDIVVGSPVAGRDRPELEGLIGLLANEVALRLKLSPGATFLSLLGEVRDACLGAFEHQDMPFEKLVLELNPERSLSRNPLFQVLFSLTTGLGGRLQLNGLEPTAIVSAPVEIAKVDLSLYLRDDAGTLSGWFEYNTDLFDATTIERMLDHYRILLEEVVRDSSRPIGLIPILTADERQRVLVEWNATAIDYPETNSLPEWIEAQVVRTPDAVALVCEDINGDSRQLTYRELNARANRIANFLRGRGAGPEVQVAICLDRTPDLVAGVLGIMKSGGAYLPLDPEYPQDRLRYIIDDSQAPLLLTTVDLREMFPEFSGDIICLDAPSDAEAIEQQSGENPVPLAGLAATAYTLYTSGSTGKPKGVQITHRNVINFLATMRELPGICPDDTLLAVTTLSFDIAGLELYLPLVTGARVLLASRDQARDANSLMRLMERWDVTILQATPVTWWMLLEAGWNGTGRLKALCGGEALPGDLAGKLVTCCKELWNMYGPTETTIWSSIYRVEQAPGGIAPIGRPVGNTTMYVLDGFGQPQPVGVPGELYIGGDGVGRGYLNRPELTAEKFVADPYRAGGACTGRGMCASGARTGTSSIWAGRITRSNCVVSESNWGRSRPYLIATPRSGKAWQWCSIRMACNAWLPG